MTEPPPEVPKNELAPSTSIVSHAGLRGYPVLVNIQYPFMEPIGALRYMETPRRRNLRQVIDQVLATNEAPNDPTRFMKSLSARKGNTTYDVLGYLQDDIGSLLHEIIESEKLVKIECVYRIV